MPVTYYTEEEFLKLEADYVCVCARLAAVESLRPQWAQGYTSDSMAAQSSSDALQSLWTKLRVNNQTDAMMVLDRMIADLVKWSPLHRA